MLNNGDLKTKYILMHVVDVLTYVIMAKTSDNRKGFRHGSMIMFESQILT